MVCSGAQQLGETEPINAACWFDLVRLDVASSATVLGACSAVAASLKSKQATAPEKASPPRLSGTVAAG